MEALARLAPIRDRLEEDKDKVEVMGAAVTESALAGKATESTLADKATESPLAGKATESTLAGKAMGTTQSAVVKATDTVKEDRAASVMEEIKGHLEVTVTVKEDKLAL